ncbi:MAG: hypothetical protein AABX66_03330 [Nanoarchaeota archaeon]
MTNLSSSTIHRLLLTIDATLALPPRDIKSSKEAIERVHQVIKVRKSHDIYALPIGYSIHYGINE